MNSYYIQKSILTSVQVYETLEYSGYKIQMFGEHSTHKGIMVEKTITARSMDEAYRQFILGLIPILNRIVVLTQCSVEPLGKSSALINRQNDNPNKEIFFYNAQKRSPVGMDLEQDHIKDLEKLKEKDLDLVFDLLRESNYATTPKLRLALLIIAAEALAGDKRYPAQKCKSCGLEVKHSYIGLDKDKMVAILGTDLYNKLYKDDRIRHRFFHGKEVDDEQVAEVSSNIYKRLLFDYLKPKFTLGSLSQEAKAVPRNDGSFEYTGAYIRPLNDKKINFEDIEKQFDSPNDFEIIDSIPDY